MVVKRIVCLANSRKNYERCVAGKELLPSGRFGGWIRPVSDRPTQGVSSGERQYASGSYPRLLDVMGVPLLGPQPENHQQENWLLDPSKWWERVGTVGWGKLGEMADSASLLWDNGYSTRGGCNDRVPVLSAHEQRDSLRLIHLDTMEIVVSSSRRRYVEGRFTDKRVQGQFIYGSDQYWLWVTDSKYEREYVQRPEGRYAIGECFVTVSLAEPYDGYCYKLIAGIVER